MQNIPKKMKYDPQNIVKDFVVNLFEYYELPLPGKQGSQFDRTTFSRDVMWGAFVVEYVKKYGGNGIGDIYTRTVNCMYGDVTIGIPEIPGLTDALDAKVDVVEGMGLSENDFTDELLTKLNNIQEGGEVNVQSDWLETDTNSDAFIKNKPAIQFNGGGGWLSEQNFTSEFRNKLIGVQQNAEENVQSDWIETDTQSDAYILNKPEINFTGDGGYLSEENFTTILKTKLDNIQEGAEVNVQADWAQGEETADDFIKNKPDLSFGSSEGFVVSNFEPSLDFQDKVLSFETTHTSVVPGVPDEIGVINIQFGEGLDMQPHPLMEDTVVITAAGLEGKVADLKTKLDTIQEGAEVNVQSDWLETDPNSDAFIKSKPIVNFTEFEGGGWLSEENFTHDLLEKLENGVEQGAQKNVQSDWVTEDERDDSYIKNKPIVNFTQNDGGGWLSEENFTRELAEKLENGVEDGAQKNVQSDWNATEGDALILNKPDLDFSGTGGYVVSAVSQEPNIADQKLEFVTTSASVIPGEPDKEEKMIIAVGGGLTLSLDPSDPSGDTVIISGGDIETEVAEKVDKSVFDETGGWLVSDWKADLANSTDIVFTTTHTDVTGTDANKVVPVTLSVTGNLTVSKTTQSVGSHGAAGDVVIELGTDLTDYDTHDVIQTALDTKFDKVNVIDSLTDAEEGKVADSLIVRDLQVQINAIGASARDRGTVRNAFTSQGNTYKIISAVVNEAGVDYQKGDAIFIQSDDPNDINAIYVVDGVHPSTGAVTSIQASKEGDYGTAQTGVKQAAGGFGTGLTLTVTSSEHPASTLNSIQNPISGDRAVVIYDEVHNLLKYQYAMMDYNGDGQSNWVPMYNIDDLDRDFYNSPIMTGELGNLQVTTAKVATGAITPDKLSQSYMPLTGGEMVADINMGGYKITNTGSPVNNKDVTNKLYVDTADAVIQADVDLKAYISDMDDVCWDGDYYKLSNIPVDATQSVHGLMSVADKVKMDGIAAGAEVNVQSDWNVSTTTDDAYIKNKPGVVTTSVAGFMSSAMLTKLNGVATGAEVNVQSNWTESSTSSDAYIMNKPGNATTSTAGFMSASDKAKLDNYSTTPSSPGNGTITIKRANDSGTGTIGSFTVNQTSAYECTIPLVTTNNSGLMLYADKVKLNTVLTEWFGTQSAYSGLTKSDTTLYFCYE